MAAAIEVIRTISEVALADLPQPQGFYMLVRMHEVSEKVNANSPLLMPKSRQADESTANPLAEVVLMGPECFLGPNFPSGPRCKVGDTILMPPYSGQQIIVGPDLEAPEYRVINDLSVTCVVPRPELVRRGL